MKYGMVTEETPFVKKDKMEQTSERDQRIPETAIANDLQLSRDDAVIFSIQFYGKQIGEVGMMDQDLSELDWKKFKSYLFQNLLTINHQENICVSYSDEDGDKLPIESDEEYQEALKLAKRKAESHDKMVLDITRHQGAFPAMFSLVSSGIKKVSSSPPKEGSISFFKASSPPKDNTNTTGFKPIGAERKLFQGVFMPDKGPIPGHVQGVWGYDCDEAQEIINTANTKSSVSPAHVDCKRGPPVRGLLNSPPNLLIKWEAPKPNHSSSTEICQDIFGAGIERSSTGARPKDVHTESDRCDQPPQWFIKYMEKFRTDLCQEITQNVVKGLAENRTNPYKITQKDESEPIEHKTVDGLKKKKLIFDTATNAHTNPSFDDMSFMIDTNIGTLQNCLLAIEKKDTKQENKECNSNVDLRVKDKTKKKEEKTAAAAGVKRKKLLAQEEKLIKKQEKLDKKKLNLTSKFVDEVDKASRSQEKVFAEMEGLRKKQFCTREEISRIRKMVEKQKRYIPTEQYQQRLNGRKAGSQRFGKSKMINIDNKYFPDDASLLHAAIQELEALAEDSIDTSMGPTPRGFNALYLNDVTYPDGSVVAPGMEFVKTWKVANNGVMPWSEKTTLSKWSQVRFRGSPAGWKLKSSLKKVVCPPLKPGEEGEISITFTAPSEPGWYATHWRFCERGRVFGNQMWCAIRVEEPSNTTDLSETQLEKTVVDENGVTQRLFLSENMQELKVAMLPQPTTQHTQSLQTQPVISNKISLDPVPKEASSQNDLGIIENYYDAEDPIQKECNENFEKMVISLPSEQLKEEQSKEKKVEEDLISFEEEAELLDSRSSSPQIILPRHTHVVPLKEMAKESLQNFKMDQESHLEDNVQPDSISMSSGSFSELDSEDQAILNESDSEGSDHEYYVVNLPDCFSSSPVVDGVRKRESSTQSTVVWQEGLERPESPDFLTADEDDRTTAVASNSSEDLTCPANDHNYARDCRFVSHSRNDSDSSCNSSKLNLLKPSTKKSPSDGPEEMDEQELSISSSLPAPPVSKRFMSIPNEAISIRSAKSSTTETNCSQTNKDKETSTWARGDSNETNVVCQQPFSAQVKDSKDGSSTSSQTSESNSAALHPSSQLPVDLVGALPDELVSIIPEDLVRGAWNTARSFITRINQEMLSPTNDSPGHVYQEECSSELPQSPECVPPSSVPESQPPPEEESSKAQSADTTVKKSPSPTAPPMQQLEDMGFHNKEVNKRLLTKYNGDVSCAVAELIVLNCH